MTRKVLVTGGAGYVGAVLVPQLLGRGYAVRVLDLYIYGENVLDSVRDHKDLEQVKGDLRDMRVVREAVRGCDSVIHLACISNDPSFDLNPQLGRSINYDAFEPLVQASKQEGVNRFVYASSSSVYGVKELENVDEETPLEPLTDYSKFKAMCEEQLIAHRSRDFVTTIVRPATVCGYSPRQRLDVIVNILTNQAVRTGRIRLLGGDQKRPNIHIQDMVDVYLMLMERPRERIDGGVYNVGCENHTVRQLGELVRTVVGREKVAVDVVPTNDNRSYHISSERIARELGFRTRYTISDAVGELALALTDGRLVDSLNNSRYFNIKRMQEVHLI
ncbi:MAG: NAD-dependent epimerase/dehydratase [Verrucomicrobiota bacterium]